MNTAELINQGPIQSVQLKGDMRLEGTEVYVKRIGRSIILIPKDVDPWQLMRDSLGEFTADYMADRNPPEHQYREAIFE